METDNSIQFFAMISQKMKILKHVRWEWDNNRFKFIYKYKYEKET